MTNGPLKIIARKVISTVNILAVKSTSQTLCVFQSGTTHAVSTMEEWHRHGKEVLENILRILRG